MTLTTTRRYWFTVTTGSLVSSRNGYALVLPRNATGEQRWGGCLASADVFADLYDEVVVGGIVTPIPVLVHLVDQGHERDVLVIDDQFVLITGRGRSVTHRRSLPGEREGDWPG